MPNLASPRDPESRQFRTVFNQCSDLWFAAEPRGSGASNPMQTHPAVESPQKSLGPLLVAGRFRLTLRDVLLLCLWPVRFDDVIAHFAWPRQAGPGRWRGRVISS